MGYCPYICVSCGKIEDNGWHGFGGGLSNYNRVRIQMYYSVYEGRGKLPFYNIIKNGHYDKEHDEIIGPDVCHNCLPDWEYDNILEHLTLFEMWDHYVRHFHRIDREEHNKDKKNEKDKADEDEDEEDEDD